MRSALRKPPRAAPSLLSLPNRDRLMALFSRNCLIPHDLIAMELERRHTLTFGEVAVLSAFVKNLPTLDHMMPREFADRDIEGAAEILGQNAMRVLRMRGSANAGRQRITGSI